MRRVIKHPQRTPKPGPPTRVWTLQEVDLWIARLADINYRMWKGDKADFPDNGEQMLLGDFLHSINLYEADKKKSA